MHRKVRKVDHLFMSVHCSCDGELGLWPDALIPATDPFDKQRRNAFPAIVRRTALASQIDVYIPISARFEVCVCGVGGEEGMCVCV